MTWTKAMGVGMLPFLPGDALKIAVAVPIVRALRPIMQTGNLHTGIDTSKLGESADRTAEKTTAT